MSHYITACLLALFCTGCHAFGSSSHDRYETIQSNPHRKPRVAQEQTERAYAFLDRGDLYKAEKALRKALVADVTYAPAHNNLGEIYFQRGDYYQASWEFEYAHNLAPDSPEPLNNLGLVYEAVGRAEDALSHYRLALEFAPQNPHVIGNLARAKIRLERFDDELHYLLQELLMYETRPAWRAWAGERLATTRWAAPAGEGTGSGPYPEADPGSAEPGAPETLPLVEPLR